MHIDAFSLHLSSNDNYKCSSLRNVTLIPGDSTIQLRPAGSSFVAEPSHKTKHGSGLEQLHTSGIQVVHCALNPYFSLAFQRLENRALLPDLRH